MTLQEACDQINIVCREVPTLGKNYTTSIIGKGPGNKSGRIRLFPDGRGGILFNNVDGISLVFFFDDAPTKMTEADKAERAEREARAQQELDESRQQCREESDHQFNNVARDEVPADHAYIVAKGITPVGIRWQSSGNLLIVPVADINGVMHGLQYISADGSKKFKTGTAMSGNFHKIGKSKDNTIIVCEGYATGVTI